MRHYKKTTIFGNTGRLSELIEFRDLVVKYFGNAKYDLGKVRENPDAQSARQSINFKMEKVHLIILASGVTPNLIYSPPPAIGGRSENIDLIQSIFLLPSYSVNPSYILDFINRSIGVYSDDRSNSLLRTINPFFWISLIFAYIVSLPFNLLGELGFNQSKIESSIIGKIVKLLVGLISLSAALVTLYTILPSMIEAGYFDIIL